MLSVFNMMPGSAAATGAVPFGPEHSDKVV
jgi:hypothetical protein